MLVVLLVIYINFSVEWEEFTCYPVQASCIAQKFYGEHNDIAEQWFHLRGQRFIKVRLSQNCMNYQN